MKRFTFKVAGPKKPLPLPKIREKEAAVRFWAAA